MTTVLDGKALAAKLRTELARKVAKLKNQGITPGLAAVLVGDNPASHIYVRNKRQACEEVGITSFPHDLPKTTTERELLTLIDRLNRDPSVHGILIQLPLPKQINEEEVTTTIDPCKDVDCFHPVNVGRLTLGQPCLIPCTPGGIMAMLDAIACDPAGKQAVVVGRSNIVGKPTALLLLRQHATVTICHSHTADLPGVIGQADIVVAAMGRPAFIKGDWIKKGAVVIDVGINRLPDGKLVGDVDFEGAKKRAQAITPVPGGVGPMTIAMLLKNVVAAAERKTR